MDNGRVFILDFAEIRRRFRALETITATRCAHESTISSFKNYRSHKMRPWDNRVVLSYVYLLHYPIE